MIILALLLLSAAAGHPTPPLDPDEKAAENAFRACPGSETLVKTATISWRPLSGATIRHRAIRERLHLNFPESGDRILLHSMLLGETFSELSLVATRGAGGIWHIDEAGQRELALATPLIKAMPHKAYDLSPEASGRVDALLQDPCLYASPGFMTARARGANGPIERLEILTSVHRAVLGWLAVRTPPEDALVKLIGGD
jgi:hypothetical protein